MAASVSATWLSMAVTDRYRGHPRTTVNWDGLLQTTPHGFEDRGPTVRKCPSTSAGVRLLARTFHDHPPTSAVVRHVGCHLGCHLGCQRIRRAGQPRH